MEQRNEYKTLLNQKDTIPASQALTGTITSLGNLISGSGTDFLSEIDKDWYIVDLTQNEIRRVVSINQFGVQLVQIQKPFTADITVAINLVAVPASSMRELSLLMIGATDGFVNGEKWTQNQSDTWNMNDSSARGQHGFVDPVVVDATGTEMGYSILR